MSTTNSTGILSYLRVAPAATEEVDRRYRYWRVRVIFATLIGYAVYYFVRTNLPLAIPVMEKNLGLSKSRLGLIDTLGGVTYGVSKFFNGILGDRLNPRLFMAVGLACSSLMNVFFGMSSALWTFCLFWIASNWFQGMGFPPCARTMAHWYGEDERATIFGIWHISHMVGAMIISVLAGYLVTYDWRYAFYVPAGIALVGVVFIYVTLRDTPGTLGLPPIEVWRGGQRGPIAVDPGTAIKAAEEIPVAARDEHPEMSHWQFIFHNVLSNKFVWLVSTANFFIYTIRYVVLTWAPTFLKETKGVELSHTGWFSAGFEGAGLLGALISGWATDRFFRGRAGRPCTIATALLTGALFLFWHTPSSSPKLYTTYFLCMGFLVYIPQMLIAVLAINAATKRAAATAVGLTGILGYMSKIASGFGVGYVVDHYGWSYAFDTCMAFCLVTVVLFLFTWNLTPEQAPKTPKRAFPVVTGTQSETDSNG